MSQPTLYVAGPMTGFVDFNYPSFNAAAEALLAAGYGVLNPVDSEQNNPTPGTPQAWDWYMRQALAMVLVAEGIALLPGWESSRGASLEVNVATALGMPVHRIEDWLGTDTDAAFIGKRIPVNPDDTRRKPPTGTCWDCGKRVTGERRLCGICAARRDK